METLMQYQITGKHIDIGDSLQSHVKSSVDEVVGKFACLLYTSDAADE